MGIISSLQNLVTRKVSESTREKVVSAANTALTFLTSPIGAITNFKKAKETTAKTSTLSLLAQGVETSLIAVAPFTAAGKGLAVKAGETAFKTLPRAATTITAAAAAVASPTIRNVALTALTPSTYVAAGEKVGQFVEAAPSEVKDLTSKGVVAAATGLGIVGVGVAAYELLKSDDKQGNIPTLLPELEEKPKTIETNTATPTLPETIGVTPTPTTKKRRHKTTKQPQNIIQKTNVMVNVGNKSYSLNRKVFKAQ